MNTVNISTCPAYQIIWLNHEKKGVTDLKIYACPAFKITCLVRVIGSLFP